MEPSRTIATVLFTDIVGSTERAVALGDRRWRDVLRAHHAAVREELRRHHGHEIGTAGDGFLAVFDSPVHALLSAAAIREAVKELDLSVRCGLHMGEVEREDGGVGGIAVHIGARVAELAGADEILVSGTVRDAEAGSDFEFEDRGRHGLKGLAGEWRIYALTEVPEGATATLPPPAPEPRLQRAIRMAPAAGAYVAAAAAVFLLALGLRAAFGLPDWIPGAALLLLVVGFVVVAATAWVQARPQTAVRRARGELPGAREVDPLGAFRALLRGELPHLTWGRAVAGGLFAFAMLFGAAGLWVVIQDRGRSFAPEEARADAAPGVAVLPFTVQGSDLDAWREGAVDLIGSNLDGAAGLRAIDSRTLLARWHETVKAGEEPDLATSLEVARRAGARYALLGSAVALGRDLRLSADLYDVGSGKELGQAQVQGAPDSVYMLVDRLSIQALRTILGRSEGEVPRIQLARVTTASLPALKAYLRGEVLYRKADWTGAIAAYREAVEADSTFALAWLGLGNSISWLPPEDRPPGGGTDALRRAARWSGRLPERERVEVLAYRALVEGSTTMVEPLRSAVRRYPDDPELVYLLGEFYVHFGGQMLVDPSETRRTLDRAIRLDPDFAPYYQHAIEYAFYAADSARALEWTSRFETLAGGTWEAVRYRMGATLAWGSPDEKAAARAALDTLSPHAQPDYVLIRPEFLSDGLASARARLENGGEAILFVDMASMAGRFAAANTVLREGEKVPDGLETARLFDRRQAGLRVDPDRLRRAATADSTYPNTWYAAVLAAEDGRTDGVRTFRTRARAFRDSVLAAGDTLAADMATGQLREIDGYVALQSGEKDRALDLLEEGQRAATGWDPTYDVNQTVRWTIARLLVDLGRPEEAIPWYRSLFDEPSMAFAHAALGEVYEGLGRLDEAKTEYETALDYWRDADPALGPRIAEIRSRLAGLGFRPRG